MSSSQIRVDHNGTSEFNHRRIIKLTSPYLFYFTVGYWFFGDDHVVARQPWMTRDHAREAEVLWQSRTVRFAHSLAVNHSCVASRLIV